MPEPITSILVVGPAWVGDMVIAQSLFKTLRRMNPECGIDVLAPRWTLPLLRFMPEVRNGIELPLGHGELGLRVRYRLGRALRRKGYDLAIVLPRSLKAALVPFWAGIPRRVGYRGEMRWGVLTDLRRLDPKRTPRQAEQFIALALPRDDPPPSDVPVPQLTVPTGAGEAVLAALGLARPERPLLVLAPGAEFGPAKRWPAESFAELARRKAQAGWAVWILGSPRDAEVAAQVQGGSGGVCVDLTGHTTLDQAVALIGLADAVVSNDSGLMHIAAALGRRQVALFGPSDPAKTGPLNDKARVITRSLSCSPCHRRTCPLGHHDCLRGIEPGRVLEALDAP